MNRTERRATERASKSPAKAPTRMVKQPLKQPETAAELSAREANELRGRNDEVEYALKLENDTRETLQHQIRIRLLVSQERLNFQRGLIRDHKLDENDDYQVDAEQGVILRVAALVPEELPAVEAAPVDPETTEEVNEED